MYAWSNDNETETEPTQSELELYEFSSPLKSNSTINSSSVGNSGNTNTNTTTKPSATLTDLDRSPAISDNDIIFGNFDSQSRSIRKKTKKDENIVNATPFTAGSLADKISSSSSSEFSKFEKEEGLTIPTYTQLQIEGGTNTSYTDPLFTIPSEVKDDKEEEKESDFSLTSLLDRTPASVTIPSYVRPVDARTADLDMNLESDEMIERGIEVEKKGEVEVKVEVETLLKSGIGEILELSYVKIVATDPSQPLLSVQSLPESFAVRSLQSISSSSLSSKLLVESALDVKSNSKSDLESISIPNPKSTIMEAGRLLDLYDTDSRTTATAPINPTLDLTSIRSTLEVLKMSERSSYDIQAPKSSLTFTSLPQPSPLPPPLSLSSSPFQSKFADSPLALQIAAALAADPKQAGSSAYTARTAFKRSLDMRASELNFYFISFCYLIK